MSVDAPGSTVPHIAVVLHVDDEGLERQAVLWTEACRRQLAEHVVHSWGKFAPPPGVFFYGTAEGVPEDAAAVVGIFRDAGVEDAAGYHLALGQRVLGAVDLSRTDSPSRTLSHEVLEVYRNAYLDAWAPGPEAGRDYAVELCDPVQRQSYKILVSVLGQEQEVEVADFILPAWFDAAASGPRTWCSSVREAFEVAPGGYQIAREGEDILYLPSKGGAVPAANVSRPLSRTVQITRRIVIPRPAAGAPAPQAKPRQPQGGPP